MFVAITTAKPSQSALLLITAQYEDCRCLPNEAVGHEALCWRSQHSLFLTGQGVLQFFAVQCITILFFVALFGVTFCGALLHSVHVRGTHVKVG